MCGGRTERPAAGLLFFAVIRREIHGVCPAANYKPGQLFYAFDCDPVMDSDGLRSLMRLSKG